MTLSEDEKKMIRRGARVALGFFKSFRFRRGMREGFSGFPDSAVFYRHWDLLNRFRTPEAISILTNKEKIALVEFQTAFDQMNWETVIPDVDYIKQCDKKVFKKLKRPALRLLSELEKNRSQYEQLSHLD